MRGRRGLCLEFVCGERSRRSSVEIIFSLKEFFTSEEKRKEAISFVSLLLGF